MKNIDKGVEITGKTAEYLINYNQGAGWAAGDDRKSYGEGEAVSEWKKRKTRSMVECDNCKALICWGKINGAKYDEYWQKGRKRLCPDCHKKIYC